MAYTPINWQTGDTITAEKLNRCDNGWSVTSTQLFSETVTTASGQYGAEGVLTYSGTISAETITIVFDGTNYTCNEVIDGVYGGFDNGPDFTEYPFMLYSNGGTNTLYTETAGSHAISASVGVVEAGSSFTDAVALVSPVFMATVNKTTWLEMFNAMSAGKLTYIIDASSESSARCYVAVHVYYDDSAVNKFVVLAISAYDYESGAGVVKFSAYSSGSAIGMEF